MEVLMNRLCTSLAALACVGLTTRAMAQAQGSGLLLQLQAAEVLSDLITYTVARADARVIAMQTFLREIGKDGDYAQNQPAVPRDKSMAYNQVFKGAILFVRNGGAKYANPAFASWGEQQLTDELM